MCDYDCARKIQGMCSLDLVWFSGGVPVMSNRWITAIAGDFRDCSLDVVHNSRLVSPVCLTAVLMGECVARLSCRKRSEILSAKTA